MTSTAVPMGGGAGNNPAPSSQAFALHQRSTNANANANANTSAAISSIGSNGSNDSGGYDNFPIVSHYNSSHNNINNNNNNNINTMTPSQYFLRLTDISQMDIQSAFEQMRSLLNPTQLQRVFKLSYYRKQTKGYYARDDPAFVTLQICFLILSSFAYTIAFNTGSFWYTLFSFIFQSVVVNYVLVGMLIATIGQTIANQHMLNNNNKNNTNNDTTNTNEMTDTNQYHNQPVEWMYAFDIHCNAFFPFFVIVYAIQYFILPIVLYPSFFSFLLSNVIYSLAFGYYFYITHLGYRNIHYLIHTELFLIPIVVVVFIFVLNFIGYPFGLGWNASRIMAHLYFEA